ncbi:MAG TPA: TraB/GumN family protein, partial [Candidatus Cybelea sp.]|nr:TraB/GumN family protein [Candidatus Cybelea sp.]
MKGRALIAALFAAAAFFCCIAPAVAAPALWVVQSASGGKIYLFGTVHVLRDDTQWRSPELEAAIKDSQNLYLEIADMTNVAAASSSLLKAGIDREHPLSTKITKDDVTLLNEAAKRYGLPGEASFEPMRPWLVYLMLSALSATHSGYRTSNGVDLQVRKEFADAGKPILGFETFDMQANIFAGLPESTQVALLDTELKGLGRASTTAASTAGLDRLVSVWMSGDEQQLATAMEIDKLAKTPVYAAMFTNRNKAWANVLAERLKQPGTSFVCVGAGHLVGPHGVPALLSQMGFTVSRVPIAEVATAASPSPASGASSQPMASPSPSPAPSASAPATPIPQILTPPAGWKPRPITLHSGTVQADRMWVDPNGRGIVITGHLDMTGLG